MPTIRKVAASVGETWEDEPIPQPVDPRGITRMDYPQHGSVGWMARVYIANRTHARYFADESHGGAEAALQLAEQWRDELRQTHHVLPRQSRTGTLRVVRVDQPQAKLCGWYAYAWPEGQRRIRRYFSDAAHGSEEDARVASEEWARAMLT